MKISQIMAQGLVLFLVVTAPSFALEDVSLPIQEKKFDVPLREVAVIISKEGYYPKTLSVFAGEKVRFFVTSVSHETSCLIINGKNIAVTSAPGKIVEAEAFFDRPGEFSFHCPAGKIFGTLSVLARPKKKEEMPAPKRNIASGTEVKVWRPKDE